MSSRHLFLKSRTSQKWRWLLVVLLGMIGVAIIAMYPKGQELDDGAWQSPIEPPGVTIVSHEAQALISSDASKNQQSVPVAAKHRPDLPDSASTAPAEISVNDHAQIREVLERWSLAWSSQNMNAYFDQYAKSFVPAGGQSRSAWEKNTPPTDIVQESDHP